MFKLVIDNFPRKVKFSTFPGGEEYVSIADNVFPNPPETAVIICLVKSSSDFMRLVMLVDALRIKGIKDISLDLGYMPYARQDRVCSDGESFSLKAFCKLLNSLELTEVKIADAHSSITNALVNNLVEVSQVNGFSANLDIHTLLHEAEFLVIPDVGARKKAEEILARYTNLTPIQCFKTRRNGKIEVEIPVLPYAAKHENARMVLADDLADGGATFIAVKEALNAHFSNPIRIDLVVTHGIFSKGKECLLEHFNQVEAVYDWTK